MSRPRPDGIRAVLGQFMPEKEIQPPKDLRKLHLHYAAHFVPSRHEQRQPVPENLAMRFQPTPVCCCPAKDALRVPAMDGESILTRMKARFDEVRPTLRPTAKLAEAIDYVLNRWDAFVRYTQDGRIPIDNNVIERLLRSVAIGRKNYLFFGSEHGGQTGATLYTLVQSARRNCLDVWPYLTDVLRRIAAIAPGDTAALEALLPDRWLAAHPEHRLEQREEESAKPRPVAAENGLRVGLQPPRR